MNVPETSGGGRYGRLPSFSRPSPLRVAPFLEPLVLSAEPVAL